MSQTLEKKRVRLEFDAGSYENAKDRLRSADPVIWKMNDVRFEIGAFLNLKGASPASGSEVDISNWQSLTLEVKTTGDASNLMAATTTDFDTSLTATTWNDLTKQHAAVEFTNAETNVASGTYNLAVSVILTSGAKITLGVSRLTIKDSHASFVADAAPLEPGSAISLAEADARFLRETFVTLSWIGDASDETVWGYYRAPYACRITGGTLVAQEAPTGAALTVDLVDAGAVEKNKLLTLSGGSATQDTTFGAALVLAAGDVIRLKFKSVGSTFPGQNISALLRVQLG